MFLSVSEALGVRTWYTLALKLLYAGTVPPAPGATDGLSGPQYKEAITALDIVVEARPQWAEVYYHRGIAYAGQAQGLWVNPSTAKALQDFGKALSLDPRFADVYWERAALYAKPHPQRAIADLTSLLALEPTVTAHLKRAELLLATGNKPAAAADYRSALKRYTTYCGVEERQKIETYMVRVTLELQNGNLGGVLNSLVTFWQQHALSSYQ